MNLFPKISNFCTSLGLYNIDRRCFVVRCQNLPKFPRTKVTFYIQKWAKLRATLAQLFLIFCATSATSLAQLLDFFECNFVGGLALLSRKWQLIKVSWSYPQHIVARPTEDRRLSWSSSDPCVKQAAACKLQQNFDDWCCILFTDIRDTVKYKDVMKEYPSSLLHLRYLHIVFV